MENLDFGRGHGQNFDHLTMIILKFRPWSWSKIFDHMTMTPGHKSNGQKIVVALPPPDQEFDHVYVFRLTKSNKKWRKKQILYNRRKLISVLNNRLDNFV